MSAAASAATSNPPALASVLFARGVIARLAIWPALRIAVEQGWGGSESAEKRTWIASVIVDSFEEEDPKPDVSYVEMQLLQIMEDEFDTVLEDGSAEAVAKDVVRMWTDIQSGVDGLVKHFEEQAEKLKGKKIEVEEVAGDNSDWEDESEEGESGDEEDDAPMLIDTQPQPNPRPGPEVDEDGFTMVKGKGKSHR